MPDLHPQEAHADNSQPERRRYARAHAAVQLEFRPEGAAVATHTHTTDLSPGGCYIEMSFTQKVGTKVDLVLWLADEKLATKAVIVTHHPAFGNGMEFVDMPQDDRAKLQRFLDSMSAEEKPEAELPAD
jgi:c-di-GMP-binding flagellar brake protein YcgR